ncbi:hypothetical protein SGLAM104S_06932 [Streptomyces glaucescens]
MTSSPVNRRRITWIASSSISSRTSAGGQAWPRMCSLRASPEPTPSRKRPFVITALVAAACATTAGWIRTVGQVTAVSIGSDTACESAPITDHTNGLSPWASFQGW